MAGIGSLALAMICDEGDYGPGAKACRPVQRPSRIPHLPFLWRSEAHMEREKILVPFFRRYRIRFCITSHGASLYRFWEKVKASILHLSSPSGSYQSRRRVKPSSLLFRCPLPLWNRTMLCCTRTQPWSTATVPS